MSEKFLLRKARKLADTDAGARFSSEVSNHQAVRVLAKVQAQMMRRRRPVHLPWQQQQRKRPPGIGRGGVRKMPKRRCSSSSCHS